MDITIKKIPSFNTAKKIASYIPEYLTDKQLLNNFAKITVILNAEKYGRLTDDYYNSAITASSTGYTPRDIFLFCNLRTTKEDLWQEINKRGLTDFTIWDETRESA